jgi:HD-GYP domain-containing protein (c-di-GMP phosphodiesterase class II)/ribonuclease BN (tRNA processing enzyme)
LIKVLGSYGNRGENKGTTSFLIAENIVIDAGNLSNGLGKDVEKLEHIFLSHSHFDHILDIPFVIDTNFGNRERPIKIYGLKETIEDVKLIFNNKIWPDFSRIKLKNGKNSIQFVEIEEFQEFYFGELKITTIPAEHLVPTIGFIIEKENKSIIITSDTYKSEKLVSIINSTPNLQAVLIEASFPNELEELAKSAKHLTPKLIKEMKIDKKLLYFYHFKGEFKEKIVAELKELDLVEDCSHILDDGVILFPFSNKEFKVKKKEDRFNKLLKIGVELSRQANIEYLLDDILSVAREFTSADAGSVYLKDEDKLYFKIIHNETLDTFMGGRSGEIKWHPLPLYKNGEENRNMVAVLTALTQQVYNIPDVYLDKKFDFSGTQKFDNSTGYRSKSMLVIPLINHEGETIGVLQLINKKNGNKIVEFTKEDEEITMALSSQAAISITKTKLIKQLENFIESFIKVIAKAVDEKSKYTGNHVQKVAKLAKILSNEINKDTQFFKDINYSENMLKQIEIAALLHDIGKITTDPRVMDKATKLEAYIDRIDIIAERVEIIKRDLILKGIENFDELLADFQFLKEVNVGGEFLSDEKIDRIDKIAKKYYYILGDRVVSLLRDNEKEMLKIKKGTLNEAEREHIQRHALMTLEMLSALPFPKKYQEVTHIASNHHEKLNCKGYPRKLCAEQLTFEDRLLAICDIFEALTASDRPYKKPKKLSEVFKIMQFMVKDGEIDEEIFNFFMKKRVWEKYKEELLPIQIDV